MNYEERIANMANRIIEDKEYKLLKAILKNYDNLVKEQGAIINEDYPYWELGCFFGKNVEKEVNGE